MFFSGFASVSVCCGDRGLHLLDDSICIWRYPCAPDDVARLLPPGMGPNHTHHDVLQQHVTPAREVDTFATYSVVAEGLQLAVLPGQGSPSSLAYVSV